MKKIRTALIGCGRIGFLLEADPLRKKPCTHYGGARTAGIRINYACDINPDRLRHFSKTADIPAGNTFNSYDDLINRVRPEFAIIGTWTESHGKIGMMAAKMGARVIVCEKPICPDLVEARRFCDVCKENNTSIIINHERRFDGRYLKVKDLIDRNVIGEIKTVHASILTGRYRGPSAVSEGGGPMLHDGTHMMDMVRFLFGEIVSIEAEMQREGRNRGYEDRITAWIKTERNIDVFLESGGSRNYFIFELVIYGTEGKISIGNGYESLFLHKKSRYYTGFRDLHERPFPKFSTISCFTKVYQEAKKILRADEETKTSTGWDGYKALEAVHACYYSAHNKRKIIELPINPSIINLKKFFDI